MKLSVIIPTYNRKDILMKCLTALFEQTCSKSDFEIIVIDDGSVDGTENVIKEIITKSPVELRYFKQENKGPASARNKGLISAKNEIALFLGDDIIAAPGLLQEHLNFHQFSTEINIALLGKVEWYPELKVTPFMKWLTSGGPQFGYYKFKTSEEVSFHHAYTANISYKKELLEKTGGFDENFKIAMFEDTDLGYRLYKNFNLKIIYNSYAVAYHNHLIGIGDYVRRQKDYGFWRCYFFEKHKELEDELFPHFVPSKISLEFKILIKIFLIEILETFFHKTSWEKMYRSLLFDAYLTGVSKFKNDKT